MELPHAPRSSPSVTARFVQHRSPRRPFPASISTSESFRNRQVRHQQPENGSISAQKRSMDSSISSFIGHRRGSVGHTGAAFAAADVRRAIRALTADQYQKQELHQQHKVPSSSLTGGQVAFAANKSRNSVEASCFDSLTSEAPSKFKSDSDSEPTTLAIECVAPLKAKDDLRAPQLAAAAAASAGVSRRVSGHLRESCAKPARHQQDYEDSLMTFRTLPATTSMNHLNDQITTEATRHHPRGRSKRESYLTSESGGRVVGRRAAKKTEQQLQQESTDKSENPAQDEGTQTAIVANSSPYANSCERLTQVVSAKPQQSPEHEPFKETNRQAIASEDLHVMTTQSFVPTEALISQQPQDHPQYQEQANTDSNVELEEQQFNLQQQQQSVRPIGLGCPTLVHSTSAHSINQDDDHEEVQDNQRTGLKSMQHHTSINPASSMLSLSDDQHHGQQLSGSNSTNALGGTNAKNFLNKLVGKKASRLRELVLQNLGKADKTTDELFDLYEVNFYKQQQHVQRLTKEFKLYTVALKNYHEASRSLGKCIQQSTSDYQLARHDLVCENLTHLEQLDEDLMEKLQEQVVKNVGEYLAKFDEMKEKINKRHRKLIDYDSSRRLYELMLARVNKKRQQNNYQDNQQEDGQQQQNYHSILRGIKFLSQQQQQQQMGSATVGQEASIASQLVDEARLLKLREQFNYCKLMYETINGELHDELPIVYDKKMRSLLTALQNFYEIKAHYHLNAGKLISKVGDVIVAGHEPAAKISSPGSTSYEMYGDEEDEDEEEKSATGVKSASQLITGGGSSGVGSSRGDSVADSSSPSGSSSASPDCGRHQQQQNSSVENNVSDAKHQEQLSKNVDGPADSEGCERQYAQVSSESVGEQQVDVVAAGAVDQADGAKLKHDVDVSDEVSTVEPNHGVERDDIAIASAKTIANKHQVLEDSVSDNQFEIKIIDSKLCSLKEPPVCEFKPAKADDEESAAETMTPSERGLLYKVKANYKYLAEDVDELCFEADEVIQVIEFDENYEPEDGWLLGIREVNNQRGLFPANFTQPI